MRRSLPVVLSLLVLAPCARAQTPAPLPQDACETVTTTTIRCSGAAAPLAIRPAPPAPPGPPAPVIEPQVLPPVPPPPAQDDACVECADPRAQGRPLPSRGVTLPPELPGGWRLQLPTDGNASYVRHKKTPSAAVWVPGLTLWLGSYFASMAVGISRDNNAYTTIPFFGALGTGISAGLNGDSPGAAAGYTLAGLGQIAGFVTFIVGTVAGPTRMEKMPVQIGPMASKDGGGLTLSMKF